jgi:hypothetical protein
MTLRLDNEASRLAALLHEAGIDSLLLKGPVLAQWLYPDIPRLYNDIDLLVPKAAFRLAIEVLAREGYRDPVPGAVGIEASPHARPLARADGCVVDLHQRLNGSTVRAQTVWELLWAHRTTMVLCGRPVAICDDIGALLIVVLHAAQHGIEESKPLEDLRRAALLVTDVQLRTAFDLAVSLGAAESFAAGLRLEPALAHRVPELAAVPPSLLVRARATSRHLHPGVLTLLGLTTGSARERLAVAARSIWPSRDLLIARSPRPLPGRWLIVARMRRWAYQATQIRGAVSEVVKLLRSPPT